MVHEGKTYEYDHLQYQLLNKIKKYRLWTALQSRNSDKQKGAWVTKYKDNLKTFF